MKNNTKKGFTLVELLVVIAILAILATVSVVGYTSFIESANLTVDNDLATQLNHFLAAYKVENPGDIDENNVRRVTAEILELGGVDGLIPKSKGNNFYFDFENQEYVVMEDEKAANTNAAGMNLIIHSAEPKSLFLGSSFTEGGKYFLVSTGGNKLADVVDALYSIESDENFTVETLRELVEDVKDLEDSYPELVEFVSNSVIIHQDTKYHVVEDNKYVIIPDGATQIGDQSVLLDGGSTEAPLVSNQDNAVSIPDSIEYIASANLNANVKFDMTGKTAEEVAELFLPTNEEGKTVEVEVKLGDTTVTIKTEVRTENNVEVYVTVVFDGNEEIPGKYENKLVGFDSQFASDKDKKVDSNYVVWDAGYFFVDLQNFVGEKGEGMPITNIGDVEWTVENDFATVTSNGNDRYTFTFNAERFEALRAKNGVFTLTGKIGDVEETFTVNTLYPTSVSYTLNGQNLTTDNSITLFYGDGDVFAYTLTQGTLQPNVDIANLNVAFTATPAVNHNAFKIDENGKLTLEDENANGDHTVTIETGCYSYLNKPVEIELFNKNTLVFTQENDNIVVVGDNNAITFGDLFKHNTNMEIPADAEIWITTNYGDTKFGDMDSVTKSTNATTATFAIGGQSWDTIKATELKFIADEATKNNFITEGEGANNTKVVVTVVAKDKDGNYVRIADNHKLIVVDGVNISNYDQLQAKLLSSTTYTERTGKLLVKKNIVFVSKITMDASDYIEVNAGVTIYGNKFVFDIQNGNDTKENIIRLKGSHLNNIRIVGAEYSTVNYMAQSGKAYAASAVAAVQGSTITNCYIANTRCPLRVVGTETPVIVKNSVFYGGRYANIEVAKGTLQLEGTVITINQPNESNRVGLGIIADLVANTTTTKIVANDCTLVQYNFLPKTLIGNLPIVSIQALGFSASVDLNDVANEIFANAEDKNHKDYDKYQKMMCFDDTTPYFNAGIVYANTYAIYTMDGSNKNISEQITGGGSLSDAPSDYIQLGITQTKGPLAGEYVDVTLNVYSPIAEKHNQWFTDRNAAMEMYNPLNYCGVTCVVK